MRRGHTLVYVDLWQNLAMDPADLIDGAIGAAIRERLGTVAKATIAAGVEALDLAGVMKIDTTRIGKHDGTSLTDALRALAKLSAGPIALMVDEAQHALTTTAGRNAMIALKSARDQMNSPDDVGLRLVMTGSDRDKLLRLVNTHDAPFLGSRIRDLPLLDGKFVAFVAGLVEDERPDLVPVDVAALTLAFDRLGHRPRMLEQSIGDALHPLRPSAERFEGRVLELADAERERARTEQLSLWRGLRPLERAIVWRLLETSGAFKPFDGDALAFYEATLRAGEPGGPSCHPLSRAERPGAAPGARSAAGVEVHARRVRPGRHRDAGLARRSGRATWVAAVRRVGG